MRSHVGNLVQGDVLSYVADGAIDVKETAIAVLDGTSATVAATLADGETGQRLTVKCTDATNAVTLTPDNFQDGTNITFTVNDAVELVFAAGLWHVITNYGTVIA